MTNKPQERCRVGVGITNAGEINTSLQSDLPGDNNGQWENFFYAYHVYQGLKKNIIRYGTQQRDTYRYNNTRNSSAPPNSVLLTHDVLCLRYVPWECRQLGYQTFYSQKRRVQDIPLCRKKERKLQPINHKTMYVKAGTGGQC